MSICILAFIHLIDISLCFCMMLCLYAWQCVFSCILLNRQQAKTIIGRANVKCAEELIKQAVNNVTKGTSAYYLSTKLHSNQPDAWHLKAAKKADWLLALRWLFSTGFGLTPVTRASWSLHAIKLVRFHCLTREAWLCCYVQLPPVYHNRIMVGKIQVLLDGLNWLSLFVWKGRKCGRCNVYGDDGM